MKLINPEIRIEVTNHCNSNCVICPREKMTREKTTLPSWHYKNLLFQAKQLGVTDITLNGFGEPLLDEDLWSKMLDSKGFTTHILTNASLLDKDTSFMLLNTGLKHIQFSAHGFEHAYEKVHKGLKWKITTENIFNFIKINNGRFNHSCTVGISVIPLYGEHVDDIREFWELHVDYLEMWKPHGWGGAYDFKRRGKKLKSCGRPFTGPVQIQADGKVIPCCFLTNGEIILGDTYKNTIEEILKGEKYEELRNRHRDGELEGLPCQHCDQRIVTPKSPLLYSTRDSKCETGKTSTTKFKIKLIE